MAQDIETKVREKISEQLGVAADEVTPEASFIEDLASLKALSEPGRAAKA